MRSIQQPQNARSRNAGNHKQGGRKQPGLGIRKEARNKEKPEENKRVAARKKLNAQEERKLRGWGGNRPKDALYLQYKAVFDNPKYYEQNTGNIQWPPEDGFSGKPKEITLKRHTKIDRYGFDGGTFTSPEKTGYKNRSVAPGTNKRPYSVFEVVEPIKGVKAGNIAPWFDEPGGGIQYKLPYSVKELLDSGFLEMKRRVT